MRCETTGTLAQDTTINASADIVEDTSTLPSSPTIPNQNTVRIVKNGCENNVNRNKRLSTNKIPLYSELDTITAQQFSDVIDVVYKQSKIINTMQDDRQTMKEEQKKFRERIIDLENELTQTEIKLNTKIEDLRIRQEQDYVKTEQERVAFWRTLMFWRK